MKFSKCALCGKEMNDGAHSLEHIFPRAIYKWQEEYLEKEDYLHLKSLIDSRSNKMTTHVYCNSQKEDSIDIVISTLYLGKIKKQCVYELRKELTPYIKFYTRNKNQIIINQENTCYCCKKTFDENSVIVLRRINPKLPRVFENACCVCSSCNKKNRDFNE